MLLSCLLVEYSSSANNYWITFVWCCHIVVAIFNFYRGCVASSRVDKNLYWRSKKRSAKNAQIERPKASKGRGIGRGRPPPQPTRLRALEERRKL